MDEFIRKEIEQNILNNLQCGIVEQARKDYVRGAKALITIFKKPMDKILYISKANEMILKSRPGSKEVDIRKIYWYKDAKTFVEKDPYNMFNNNQSIVFDVWDQIAWEEYTEDMKKEKEKHEKALSKANKARKINHKLHAKKEKNDI